MRILVVEDEIRVAQAIKRSLEAKNYLVDIVRESSAGLTRARQPKYELIILDLMLPGPYNGLDICRQLRTEAISTPILMLTALGEVSDKVEGLTTGADDYLAKPFSIKELIARVGVLLKRPKKHLGSILTVDGLELNTETFSAYRNGQLIKLSTREFKLLNYLMHHKNQIISKNQIIDHVWNAEAIILPNTVEVYMGYLRKKIDKAFSDQPKLIHTIFGFGYKIGISSDV